MEKFIKRYSKDDIMYAVCKVGDTVQSFDKTNLTVTNIVKITIEKEFVIVEGYGMVIDY